jgi:hypothetical protein
VTGLVEDDDDEGDDGSFGCCFLGPDDANDFVDDDCGRFCRCCL